MHPFSYVTVTRAGQAIDAAGGRAQSSFVAGGTTLLDLMKLNVETPRELIDINKVPLDKIEHAPGGGLRIGAMVRNSDLAWHALVREQYPVLSEALLSGASPQLRNMATTGGNLLQKTRCYYFRDTHCACNMRQRGSGCSAIGGYNRIHAVLGTSDQCIATHPSDMCVALMALGAVIHTQRAGGERSIPIDKFYVPYGEDPSKLNVLNPGELITAVSLPAMPYARRSHYLKARDRASFEFALASAAVVLDMHGEDIHAAHVALGGVGTKPWLSPEAADALRGKKADQAAFAAAADAALRGAHGYEFNTFKIELAKRVLTAALTHAAGMKLA